MDEKTRKQIAAFEAEASAAAQAWVAEAQKNIERKVRDILDARLVEVVGTLLGFRARFGDWEVDHWNRRSGESAVSDWLRDRAGDTVKRWLDEQAGKLPSLPAAARQALRREYLHELRRHTREALLEQAVEDATAAVGRILAVRSNDATD